MYGIVCFSKSVNLKSNCIGRSVFCRENFYTANVSDVYVCIIGFQKYRDDYLKQCPECFVGLLSDYFLE